MIAVRPTVLVVEDDRDVREAVTEVLEEHGYEVIGADNGSDALERLRDGPRPHLILLDIMMPVMDGWEFREVQRRDPCLADIPVVVMTAHVANREAAAGLEPAGFLKKPVRLDTLLETVGRVCSHEPS